MTILVETSTRELESTTEVRDYLEEKPVMEITKVNSPIGEEPMVVDSLVVDPTIKDRVTEVNRMVIQMRQKDSKDVDPSCLGVSVINCDVIMLHGAFKANSLYMKVS